MNLTLVFVDKRQILLSNFAWGEGTAQDMWLAVPEEVMYAAWVVRVVSMIKPQYLYIFKWLRLSKIYICLSVCAVSQFSKGSFTQDGFHLVISVLSIAYIRGCVCVCTCSCMQTCVSLCASVQDIKFNPVTIHLSTEPEKAPMSWVIHVVQRRPLSRPLKTSTNPKQNTDLI